VSEVNKELVRRHFEEIFNRKNLAACDDTVAQEYKEHAVAQFGQSAPGKVAPPSPMRTTQNVRCSVRLACKLRSSRWPP